MKNRCLTMAPATSSSAVYAAWQGGPASYDAFARAFRFALRMSFSKSVDQIVRNDVLMTAQHRQIQAAGGDLKRINPLVEGAEIKIKQGQEVSKNFEAALAEARKSATWTGLQASRRTSSATRPTKC